MSFTPYVGAPDAAALAPVAGANTPEMDAIEKAGYPPLYAQVLEEMAHQFEILTGFLMPITADQLVQAARAGVTTQQEFGSFMFSTVQSSGTTSQQQVLSRFPGAQFGLDDESMMKQGLTFQDVWLQMTGQKPWETDPTAWQAQVKDAMTQGLSAQQWQTRLQGDQSMQNTYGWLKYGLDYKQYQEEKMSMHIALGKMPSDKEALAQIDLQHQQHATMGGATAELRPSAQPGQSATNRSEVR